ncbi:MAG TPA: hypothetical protein VEY30_12890, partial [Myxococcaceae bacterium]|nr:hypothetical protein [Myxococcaceae bacterium]
MPLQRINGARYAFLRQLLAPAYLPVGTECGEQRSSLCAVRLSSQGCSAADRASNVQLPEWIDGQVT